MVKSLIAIDDIIQIRTFREPIDSQSSVAENRVTQNGVPSPRAGFPQHTLKIVPGNDIARARDSSADEIVVRVTDADEGDPLVVGQPSSTIALRADKVALNSVAACRNRQRHLIVAGDHVPSRRSASTDVVVV